MKRLVLMGLLLGPPLLAEDGVWKLRQGYDAKLPVPGGAAVELTLPSPVVMGDSIIGQFVVRNTGQESFEISTGGDYRGSSVQLRLKVRVTDAKGRVLEDLAQYENCFGGLMGGGTVKPGASEAIECPLQGYVTFTEPGIYTVEAKHDLGWLVDATHPHPVATAKIEVVMPTPEQAAARVRELCAPMANDDRSASKDMERNWQLFKLQQPVFLPALVEEAKAGRGVACIGIGNIPGADANKALLELVRDARPDVAKAANEAMLGRLPSLEKADASAWVSFFNRNPRTAIYQSWKAEFDAPLLAAATEILQSKDPAMFRYGAGFICARGTAAQGDAVLEATQRALDAPWQPRSGPKADVIAPPEPVRHLIPAVDALRQRGWRVGKRNGGTAVLLARCREYSDPKNPRAMDAHDRQALMAFATADPPILRENVIRAIPKDFDADWDPYVLMALEDKDWGVIRAACEVAGRSGRPVYIRPLVHVIETIHENFVQHAAHEAAVQLGARNDLWRAWCECITDKERIAEAVGNLVRGTLQLPENNGSSGSSNFSTEQRSLIRDAWRAFLQQHHDLLAGGGRVRWDDPSVTPAMLGTAFPEAGAVHTLHLKDGGHWPKPK